MDKIRYGSKHTKKVLLAKSKRSKGGNSTLKSFILYLLKILFFPLTFSYRKTKKLGFLKRLIVFPLYCGALTFIYILIFWMCIYLPRAYMLDKDEVSKMPARTLVYAVDGTSELGRLHGDNRYVITYEDVSQHFVQALIAQEDEEFRKHKGVHFTGLLKIPIYYIKYKKLLGSSTITMQLARNTYDLGNGIDRKLFEIAAALKIEQEYTKEEILQHYMNRIFFGHSMYGVESASRAYFEKSAKDLNLSESAMLAGIIRGPNLFSPFRNIEKALKERDRALDRMVKSEFISAERAEQAKQTEIHITPPHRRKIKLNYVMETVKGELDIILEEKNIKMGNLKVITTIDHRLQNAAKRHMESHLKSVERMNGYSHLTRTQWLNTPKSNRKKPNYLQGALVCIENKSGAVKCLLGGRSATESSYNRAIKDANKRKQISSIIKPFVYLSAIEKGMPLYVPDTKINGWPLNNDGKYYKQVTIHKAIAESRNCASVHAGLHAGNNAISDVLYLTGFKNYEVADSSFFLGAGSATPWEVATSYTIFPNKGLRFQPHIIKKITDQKGNILYQAGEKQGMYYNRVASVKSTSVIKDALERTVDHGTANPIRKRYRFSEPCGGKTGTSSKGKDAWYAGFTESLTCAVWVGFDTPKNVTPYGSGSNLALPIWARIMESAKQLHYPMYPKATPASH